MRTARLIEPDELKRLFVNNTQIVKGKEEEPTVKPVGQVDETVLIGMRRSNPCGFDIIPRGNFHGIAIRRDKAILID